MCYNNCNPLVGGRGRTFMIGSLGSSAPFFIFHTIIISHIILDFFSFFENAFDFFKNLVH